jgi:hypothetical protein
MILSGIMGVEDGLGRTEEVDRSLLREESRWCCWFFAEETATPSSRWRHVVIIAAYEVDHGAVECCHHVWYG